MNLVSLPTTISELLTINDPRLQNVIPTLKQINSTAVCVSVLGSTKFWGDKSQSICEAIGARIANLNIVLFTGSMLAVQQTVAHSAAIAKLDPSRIHHLFPGGEDGKNSGVWRDSEKYGIWHEVGDCFEKRRQALARTSNLHLLIEGGPGACQEANEVLEMGGVVLPIACTGGAASGMVYDVPKEIMRKVDLAKAKQTMRQVLCENEWNILLDKNANVEAIAEIIERAIYNSFKI